MSIYHLIDKGTATTTVPPLAVQPVLQGGVGPPQFVGITVTNTGTGALTGTVQVVVSNDLVNWSNFGTAITCNGTTTATANASLNGSFAYWGAIITAITGTNATINCLMSA